MHTNPRMLVALMLCLVIAPVGVAAASQPALAVSLKPANAKPVLAAVAPTTVTVATHASRTEVDGFGPRADVRTLAAMSGGTDVQQQTTLNGNVSDNHNDHVSTGFNDISDGAFNGAAGVSTVIQNSGNSVLIQNATIINVQFKP